MAANDYKICCGLFNAYIAKLSKRNPRVMLSDRRIISHEEILTLIAWKLEDWVRDNTNAVGFWFEGNNGNKIEVHYIEEEKTNNNESNK